MTLLWMGYASVSVADKPHILVYLSDDHSQFDCSVYSAKDMPVPHMEKLAADGLVFDNAFVASPSCAPSRAALLTGLMPARNGAEANHTFPRQGTHFLVEDLKDIGYEVVAFGKVAHGGSAKRVGLDKMNIYPIRGIRTRDWKLIHNLHPEFAFTNHSDLDRKPGAGAYWTE